MRGASNPTTTQRTALACCWHKAAPRARQGSLTHAAHTTSGLTPSRPPPAYHPSSLLLLPSNILLPHPRSPPRSSSSTDAAAAAHQLAVRPPHQGDPARALTLARREGCSGAGVPCAGSGGGGELAILAPGLGRTPRAAVAELGCQACVDRPRVVTAAAASRGQSDLRLALSAARSPSLTRGSSSPVCVCAWGARGGGESGRRAKGGAPRRRAPAASPRSPKTRPCRHPLPPPSPRAGPDPAAAVYPRTQLELAGWRQARALQQPAPCGACWWLPRSSLPLPATPPPSGTPPSPSMAAPRRRHTRRPHRRRRRLPRRCPGLPTSASTPCPSWAPRAPAPRLWDCELRRRGGAGALAVVKTRGLTGGGGAAATHTRALLRRNLSPTHPPPCAATSSQAARPPLQLLLQPPVDMCAPPPARHACPRSDYVWRTDNDFKKLLKDAGDNNELYLLGRPDCKP